MHASKTSFNFILAIALVLGLLFAAAPGGSVSAADLCVNVGGTDGCYASIQSAIGAAGTGDTINVAAGTYNEVGPLTLNKPNLTVRSTSGALATIIDVQGTGLFNGVEVLGNLGDVTFDGFTVKDFTQDGIKQSYTQKAGTAFYVLNNIVIPQAEYLRNGIEVTGDGSTVIGNTVYGKLLTTDWASCGIQVDDASNVDVLNNTIIGDTIVDYGICIAAWDFNIDDVLVQGNTVTNANNAIGMMTGVYTPHTISNISILSNTLSNSIVGISATSSVSDESTLILTLDGLIKAENNQFTGITGNDLYIGADVAAGSTLVLDAAPNWWGSITGPAAGAIVGDVIYDPWCADAACSYLIGGTDLATSIAGAPSGSTLYVAASPAPVSGGFIVNKPLTIILGDGVVIQNNSPCFTVASSHVTITAETIGAATCVPTDGASGIVVNDGLTDVTISGLEIDGSDITGSNHGIEFLGASSYIRILDNFIHDMLVDGVFFPATPTGTVEIQGNLFLNNVGLGINAGDGTVSAEYNSWGDYAGPAGTYGDGVSTNVDADPWTNVDLFLVTSGTPWANQVVTGKNITYTVKASLKNVTGAVFTLTYNPAVLDLVAGPTASGTSTFAAAGPNLFVVDEVTGTITFNGIAPAAVSATDYALFDVTFDGIGAAGTTDLAFDSTNDLFAMAPPAGFSNNVYAAALVGETVTLVAPPTVSSSDFGGAFSVGYPRTFSLTVTNVTPSVIYPALELRISLPTDATLKAWDGAAFVSVPCTSGVCTVMVYLVSGSATLDFEVTFNTAGTPAISAALYETSPEPDWLLHTLAGTTTVYSNYTVTGMVTMQGRIFRGGVPAFLTKLGLPVYGPFPMASLDVAPGNLVWLNMPVGDYKFTTLQPRYLNVTADLNKTFTLAAPKTLATLQLKGGNAMWRAWVTDAWVYDNAINVDDASVVGGAYGSTGDIDADVNFDGKVNIFDLALVGGNYGLTSTLAYGGTAWTP